MDMDLAGAYREMEERLSRIDFPLLFRGFHRFPFNVYDALWDGRYAVLTGFIGYIEGTAIPATDEELFSVMKMLNGDFVARLDEDMLFTRLWRQ